MGSNSITLREILDTHDLNSQYTDRFGNVSAVTNIRDHVDNEKSLIRHVRDTVDNVKEGLGRKTTPIPDTLKTEQELRDESFEGHSEKVKEVLKEEGIFEKIKDNKILLATLTTATLGLSGYMLKDKIKTLIAKYSPESKEEKRLNYLGMAERLAYILNLDTERTYELIYLIKEIDYEKLRKTRTVIKGIRDIEEETKRRSRNPFITF